MFFSYDENKFTHYILFILLHGSVFVCVYS